MRVILDANVVIAAAASRGLCEAVFELCLERHHLISCEALLTEITRKLRGKLRLPGSIVEDYVRLLRAHALVVEPERVPRGICRDPADEMVLGLVGPGRSDVIVTGDKDLLVLKRFGKATIATPRDFWDATRDARPKAE